MSKHVVALLLLVIGLSACSQQKNLIGPVFPPVRQVTVDNFDKDVIDSSKPVLVDFYADWCNPCKTMDATIREVASQFKGKIKIVRVNIDADPELATKYRIKAIPRLILFKDGDIIDDILGATDANRLSSDLRAQLF